MKLIDLNKFMLEFGQMKGRCSYQWGAKPDPNTSPQSVKMSDCSGWVSYILARRGIEGVPGSSIEQRDWALSLGLHEPKYSDILTFAKHDGGRLFLAGFNLGGTHRHVLFVCAGVTYECGSSLHGVGSRPAKDFLEETQWTVELPVVIG